MTSDAGLARITRTITELFVSKKLSIDEGARVLIAQIEGRLGKLEHEAHWHPCGCGMPLSSRK